MNLEALIGRELSHYNGTCTILGYFSDRGEVTLVAENCEGMIHLTNLEGARLKIGDEDANE